MKNYFILFASLIFTIYGGKVKAQTHTIQSVVASSEQSENPAGNMVDNDMNTRWSGAGIGVTATMDLGSKKNFDQLRIAFHSSDIRWTRFNLEVSDDGIVWTPISSTIYQSTVGTPLSEFENFDFTNQYARYLRYIGQGNQQNSYTSIWELLVVNASTNDDLGNDNDTQPPTAPILSSSGHADTTADLSWSGATDNVGVTGYIVYQDNVVLANNVTSTSYQVTGLSAATAYDFKVRTLDAAGNESGDSNIVSVTTTSGSGGGSGSTNSIWSESGSTASYSGEVAIGRASVPSGYKLAVDGHIRTREIRVDQDTWPDYVFAKDYNLPTLEEIQKHIQEKGHLPNIPSAKEVESNGLELGEMNRLLLEKIEELTLYIIQLQDENHKMKKETTDRIKNLESILKNNNP